MFTSATESDFSQPQTSKECKTVGKKAEKKILIQTYVQQELGVGSLLAQRCPMRRRSGIYFYKARGFIRGLCSRSTRVAVQVQQEAADTLDLQVDTVPASSLSKCTTPTMMPTPFLCHQKGRKSKPKTETNQGAFKGYLMRPKREFLLP